MLPNAWVFPGNHLSSIGNLFIRQLSFSQVVFSIFWVDRKLCVSLQWECSVMYWKGTFDTAPVSTLDVCAKDLILCVLEVLYGGREEGWHWRGCADGAAPFQ